MEQRHQQDQCAAVVTNNCNEHDEDGTKKESEGQCEECASEHDEEQHRGQDKEQHSEQDEERRKRATQRKRWGTTHRIGGRAM